VAKLWLDWSDGRYSTRPLSDEEAASREERGLDVAHVEDGVYDAYLRHCAEDGVWQALWRSISNEQCMRRREKELLPLEDAEREIARLKDELARAQRMQKFYEERYAAHLSEGRRQASLHNLPGCSTTEGESSRAAEEAWARRKGSPVTPDDPKSREGRIQAARVVNTGTIEVPVMTAQYEGPPTVILPQLPPEVESVLVRSLEECVGPPLPLADDPPTPAQWSALVVRVREMLAGMDLAVTRVPEQHRARLDACAVPFRQWLADMESR
jgi:hypothetical protein